MYTDNNKNGAVKEFLADFLGKLELERKITLHREKILKKQNKMNRLARTIVYLESINLGIQAIKNIQFESVDNIDSVKKLKKAELLFSGPYYVNHFKFLENFKFSYCTSQIHSDFLTYADIEIQLDTFDKKAIDLLHRGYKSAGTEASWVVLNLRNLNQWFFKEKIIDYDDYRSRALEIINQSRSVLEQHWGYKEFLGNLVLLILGIPCVINKIVNGHFLFFQKPNCSEQLNKLNQAVAQLSL